MKWVLPWKPASRQASLTCVAYQRVCNTATFWSSRSADESTWPPGGDRECCHRGRCSGSAAPAGGAHLASRLLHQHAPDGGSTLLPDAGETKMAKFLYWPRPLPSHWPLSPTLLLYAAATQQQLLAFDEVSQPGLRLQLHRGGTGGPGEGRLHRGGAVLLRAGQRGGATWRTRSRRYSNAGERGARLAPPEGWTLFPVAPLQLKDSAGRNKC